MKLNTLTVVLFAATLFGQAPSKSWTPSKTSWGDPDLQGTWTSDDLRDVPFERPAQFGTRRYLTDEELAERAKQVDAAQTDIIGKGIRPTRVTGLGKRA
jgi:hypothetical protein